MKFGIFRFTGALIGVTLLSAAAASAQVRPSATQNMELSAFAGVNGTNSGLNSGKNIGITAGADLSVHLFSHYLPSVEVRATYPFFRGGSASAENVFAGFKVERIFGPFHPYVDALYGRAQLQYANGGYPNPAGTFVYTKSYGNVPSLGGGLDFNLNRHFALKADAQYQRYPVPVTESRRINAYVGTLGVVYRFDFDGHQFFRR